LSSTICNETIIETINHKIDPNELLADENDRLIANDFEEVPDWKYSHDELTEIV
jgi:hypothetical protein